MTDYLFPVDVVPMSRDEIIDPDLEHHSQALKRVRINEKSQTTFDVQNAFDYCNRLNLYCVLCIWRDKNWSVCYKLTRGWPENGKPYPGKLEKAYLESKTNHKHFFCLDNDFSDTYPHFCLKKLA